MNGSDDQRTRQEQGVGVEEVDDPGQDLSEVHHLPDEVTGRGVGVERQLQHLGGGVDVVARRPEQPHHARTASHRLQAVDVAARAGDARVPDVDARVRDVAGRGGGAAVQPPVDDDARADRRAGLDRDGAVRVAEAEPVLAERRQVGVVVDGDRHPEPRPGAASRPFQRSRPNAYPVSKPMNPTTPTEKERQ